jgi:hypothetical protein
MLLDPNNLSLKQKNQTRSIGNVDFDLIRRSLKEKDFDLGLDHLFDVILTQFDNELVMILDGILEFVQAGALLQKRHLNAIREYFDLYGENVQQSAIDVYLEFLKRNPEMLKNELNFCIKNSQSFDPIIRERIIDFFIDDFPLLKTDYQEEIVDALMACLQDSMWRIRIKLVSFFKMLLECQSQILLPRKKDFLIMFYESDLDVLAENMDFLYDLIEKLFDHDDLVNIFNSISKLEWIAQEHILWIIGRLGRNHHQFIAYFIPDLIKLLDHIDPLLQKCVMNTIVEILDVQPALFDDAFFTALKDESIENIDAIEHLILESILQTGEKRFLQLFIQYADWGEGVIRSITNVIKRLDKIDFKLAEASMKDITRLVRQDFPIYTKAYIAFLSKIPYYNLFLIAYKMLQEDIFAYEYEFEHFRQQIVDFLLKHMPELGYYNLASWLQKQMKNGAVAVQDVCEKFNFTLEKLTQILQDLLLKGVFEAQIIDNMILPPIQQEEFTSSQGELTYLKKWEIRSNEFSNRPDVYFYIKIENNTTDKIEQLNAIMVNPADIIVEEDQLSSTIQFRDELLPKANTTMVWKFQKREDLHSAKASYIKLVFMYQRKGVLNSTTKKIDLFAL